MSRVTTRAPYNVLCSYSGNSDSVKYVRTEVSSIFWKLINWLRI